MNTEIYFKTCDISPPQRNTKMWFLNTGGLLAQVELYYKSDLEKQESFTVLTSNI